MKLRVCQCGEGVIAEGDDVCDECHDNIMKLTTNTMACTDCDNETSVNNQMAYYRWSSKVDGTDVATVGLVGCRKHLMQLLNFLNTVPRRDL